MQLTYFDRLIKFDDPTEAKEILADTPIFQTIDQLEHLGGLYYFDSIMLAAKQHSAFLIDLSGTVTTVYSEPYADDSMANIYTKVEGIEGDVIFRMEKSPTGRWRVQQVIIPNGNEDMIPWSVPSE